MRIHRRTAITCSLGWIVALALGSEARGASSARVETNGLVVTTRRGVPIGGPAILHGRSFTDRTGITVRVVQTPFDRLYDDIMVGFITGRNPYDVLIVPSAWLGDLAPYLAPVPTHMIETEAFRDIHSAYRDGLMRWQDTWMAMTVDGDLHIGAYRTDLFEDAGHRQAFADTFGYSLAPPATWAQYRDIAAYFHGKPLENGRTLVGTLEGFAPGGQRIWTLFSRAAAYMSDPDQPGSMFFDPDTMAPSIANPGWVRALEEFAAVRLFVPADFHGLNSFGVRSRFVAGEAAMIIDWTDTGVLSTDPARSTVAGRVGFFMLPGSDQVWSQSQRAWISLGQVRRVPFLAFGGWVAAVPAGSSNVDAAWRYIAWYGSPENSRRDVTDGASGINPYRRSHLDDPQLWLRTFDNEDTARAYIDIIGECLDSPDLARDLRIPGFRAYMAVLDEQIGRTVEGALEPQAALADAANSWERITDRLGREGQRRHYRRAMGLPV